MMKKFTFIYLPLGLLFAFAIHLILFQLQLGHVSVRAEEIYEKYEIKNAYVESIDGRKILFASGSGMLFNLSAEMAESELGIPCVNYGVHAGLRTAYILDKVAEQLEPGDIVVLGFEYELYLWEGDVSKVLANYITTRDVTYFRKLPFLKRLNIALSFSSSDLLTRCGWLPKIEKAKGNAEVNKWGDRVDNALENQTDAHRQELGRVGPFISQCGMKEQGWAEVEVFIETMRQRGVNVVALYPTTMQFTEYNSPSYKLFFNEIELFYSDLGVDVLGTPEMFMYPKEGFYNTIYHALDSTKRDATSKVILLMKEYLSKKR